MQPFGRRFHMLIAAALLATGLAVPASAAPLPGDEAVGASHLGSYLAGRLARGKNDTRSAVAFYRQALKRDPNNQRIIGHAFLMEATEGNGDQATALARRLVKFDRANRLAQLWIGLAEFKNGNYRAADRHFAAASSGPIGELTASLARSWNAVAAGRSRAALQLLRHLVELVALGLQRDEM